MSNEVITPLANENPASVRVPPPATGSAPLKRDADSSLHRYGSQGWRDAEARRITRDDAKLAGWRKALRRIRQHRANVAYLLAQYPELRPGGLYGGPKDSSLPNG